MMKDEEYIKDTKIIEKTELEQEREIIMSIVKAKKELENLNKNFEYAEDELIDYYTYQIKANQSKIDYLVKKAKNKRITLNMLQAIEAKLYDDKAV